jgi:hypothetical protein
MESEHKQGSLSRWQPEEVIKLNEIVRDFEDATSERGIPFWQKVADRLKVFGFNREARGTMAKWRRLQKKAQLINGKKRPSSLWDVSDSEVDDVEDEDKEDEEDENDVESKRWVNFKDGSFKPWTEGNNWSDEESLIAYNCISGQREREARLGVEPVSADQIWHMVSNSLANHGYYRKPPNCCRYWNTKGKEKWNLDARTASAIESVLGETRRMPENKQGNPSTSIPPGSLESVEVSNYPPPSMFTMLQGCLTIIL